MNIPFTGAVLLFSLFCLDARKAVLDFTCTHAPFSGLYRKTLVGHTEDIESPDSESIHNDTDELARLRESFLEVSAKMPVLQSCFGPFLNVTHLCEVLNIDC